MRLKTLMVCAALLATVLCFAGCGGKDETPPANNATTGTGTAGAAGGSNSAPGADGTPGKSGAAAATGQKAPFDPSK